MPPNHEEALHLWAQARTHERTAGIAAATDPEIAYDALYAAIVDMAGALVASGKLTVFEPQRNEQRASA